MSLLDDLDEAFVNECERAFFDLARQNAEDDDEQSLPIPADPVAQAQQLDPGFVAREHLLYLAKRVAAALERVEAGEDARLIVNMPPRMGKSTLVAIFLLIWILRKHPTWKTALVSSEASLAAAWSRGIRQYAEENPDLGINLSKRASAAAEWETVEKGGVLARGIKGGLVGRGAKILILDDLHKGFIEASSESNRQAVWDWWLTVGYQRLEPPSLVIVVMTRWHQDDFVGRLLSIEHEGDPGEWEVIRFPAIADHNPEAEDGSDEVREDALGREPGDPLLTPLIPNETPAQAVERWGKTKRNVGSYAWAAQFQQRPAPAKGAIFDVDWLRFWHTDPLRASDDGKIIHFNPLDWVEHHGVRWLESWDMAFKDTKSSDYVVGQRWMRLDANRYLIAQVRNRWSFTRTIAGMLDWAEDPTYGELIQFRLVEDKANGTAVIDTLKEKVPGLKPVNPTDSKIARAQSVTPEMETQNVVIPHPSMPGFDWVNEYIDELRNFPTGSHDDQVDGTSQALRRLRLGGASAVVTAAGMGRKVIGA